MYGKSLRALSISTVAAMALALALVFFYAPLEAEQGFLQKIFYVHVPLSIVALSGFVIGGARATSPLLSTAHNAAPAARWLLTLGLYDLVFGLIAYALFDFLLED